MMKLKGETKREKMGSAPLWRGVSNIPLFVIIIAASILLFAGANFWYYKTMNAHIAATNQATQQFIKESDAKIEQIKKANEKKAAEEKARQEQAAKDVAEQAINGNSSNALTIDSKACNTSKTHNNPANIDVIVNKTHCIQPLSYVPNDLVTSNGATLSAKAIEAYNRMYAAASAAGQPFYVSSSYRSYQTQVATYNHWVSVSGRAGADTYSARPGYSEHQTGFAFDVGARGCALSCFGSTSQYTWLQQHAADYGFIQRYYKGYESITGYKAEEWHYRYVGVAVAQDMKAKGVKTLEQYWNIPGGNY